MNTAWLNDLKQFGTVITNTSFRKLTTVQIGGKILAAINPFDIISLMALLQFLKTKNCPYLILGNGSNILAGDNDYDGVVIQLKRHFNKIYFQAENVLVEAGTSLIQLAQLAAQKSLANLEWAAGIPATVGGAIVMNAGAYRKEISQIVEKVLVLDQQELRWLAASECDFGYRMSVFQNKPYIVLAAKLNLVKGDAKEILETMQRRQKARLNSQPLEFPSFGSAFRNLENESIWHYIDKIGARGMMIGGAQVSEKHCNFLINRHHSSASDMEALMNYIIQQVQQKFGITLQPEVIKFNWNNNLVK